MPLQDAVEIDLVVVRSSDKQKEQNERAASSRSLQIVGIIDPRTGQEVPLADAIREGLFDQATGS